MKIDITPEQRIVLKVELDLAMRHYQSIADSAIGSLEDYFRGRITLIKDVLDCLDETYPD